VDPVEVVRRDYAAYEANGVEGILQYSTPRLAGVGCDLAPGTGR
jgi:hypothetical protein